MIHLWYKDAISVHSKLHFFEFLSRNQKRTHDYIVIIAHNTFFSSGYTKFTSTYFVLSSYRDPAKQNDHTNEKEAAFLFQQTETLPPNFKSDCFLFLNQANDFIRYAMIDSLPKHENQRSAYHFRPLTLGQGPTNPNKFLRKYEVRPFLCQGRYPA